MQLYKLAIDMIETIFFNIIIIILYFFKFAICSMLKVEK